MTEDDKVEYIKYQIGKHFRCFGKGSRLRNEFERSPITEARKDSPLEFAAGVSVDEVVRSVIGEWRILSE